MIACLQKANVASCLPVAFPFCHRWSSPRPHLVDLGVLTQFNHLLPLKFPINVKFDLLRVGAALRSQSQTLNSRVNVRIHIRPSLEILYVTDDFFPQFPSDPSLNYVGTRRQHRAVTSIYSEGLFANLRPVKLLFEN